MNKSKPTIDQAIKLLKVSADIQFKESELWLSVILQSLEDLKPPKTYNFKKVPKNKKLGSYRIKTIQMAKRLHKRMKNIRQVKNEFAENIKTAVEFHSSKYFEYVCDNAGLHHEYARRIIKQIYTT